MSDNKYFELISPNIRFDFIGKAKYFVTLSILAVCASIYIFFAQGESKYGTDFLGGYSLKVAFDKSANVSGDKIRETLSGQGVENGIVQKLEVVGEKDLFSIKLPLNAIATTTDSSATKELGEKVSVALKAINPSAEILGTDYIGPTMGAELKKNATIALSLGLLVILIYVTVRFEFAFALGAVLALLHDVIVCLGVYLLTKTTLSMTTVAAALTIVGYSVNDTIVIFDRIREEIFKRKEYNLPDLINECVCVTLGRTIITSLLTFFSAAALYFYGGSAIYELSLFLVVGLIVGSYSTIFVASPIVLAWERFRTGK